MPKKIPYALIQEIKHNGRKFTVKIRRDLNNNPFAKYVSDVFLWDERRKKDEDGIWCPLRDREGKRLWGWRRIKELTAGGKDVDDALEQTIKEIRIYGH